MVRQDSFEELAKIILDFGFWILENCPIPHFKIDDLLGEILIRKNLITSEQLISILIQQKTVKKKLGELLLDLGLISTQQLEKALQEQYWRQNGYWVIGAID